MICGANSNQKYSVFPQSSRQMLGGELNKGVPIVPNTQRCFKDPIRIYPLFIIKNYEVS